MDRFPRNDATPAKIKLFETHVKDETILSRIKKDGIFLTEMIEKYHENLGMCKKEELG